MDEKGARALPRMLWIWWGSAPEMEAEIGGRRLGMRHDNVRYDQRPSPREEQEV